ncbi:hypothetical protein SFUMM280S_09687 [Streptomyces fumanus]
MGGRRCGSRCGGGGRGRRRGWCGNVVGVGDVGDGGGAEGVEAGVVEAVGGGPGGGRGEESGRRGPRRGRARVGVGGAGGSTGAAGVGGGGFVVGAVAVRGAGGCCCGGEGGGCGGADEGASVRGCLASRWGFVRRDGGLGGGGSIGRCWWSAGRGWGVGGAARRGRGAAAPTRAALGGTIARGVARCGARGWRAGSGARPGAGGVPPRPPVPPLAARLPAVWRGAVRGVGGRGRGRGPAWAGCRRAHPCRPWRHDCPRCGAGRRQVRVARRGRGSAAGGRGPAWAGRSPAGRYGSVSVAAPGLAWLRRKTSRLTLVMIGRIMIASRMPTVNSERAGPPSTRRGRSSRSSRRAAVQAVQVRYEDQGAPQAVDDGRHGGEQVDDVGDGAAQLARGVVGDEQGDAHRDRDRDGHGDDRRHDGAEGQHRDAELGAVPRWGSTHGGEEVRLVLAEREHGAVRQEGRDGGHQDQDEDAGAARETDEDAVSGGWRRGRRPWPSWPAGGLEGLRGSLWWCPSGSPVCGAASSAARAEPRGLLAAVHRTVRSGPAGGGPDRTQGQLRPATVVADLGDDLGRASGA